MRAVCLLLGMAAAASAFAGSRARLSPLRPASAKSTSPSFPRMTVKEVPNWKYMREFMQHDTDKNMVLDWNEFLAMQPPGFRAKHSDAEIRAWFDAADTDHNGYIDPNEFFAMVGLPPIYLEKEVAKLNDEGRNERTAWWAQGAGYSESFRKDRRTIFMHDEWVRHRSSDRFFRNLKTTFSSSILESLSKELSVMVGAATFVVGFNMAFYQYQDWDGVAHAGPLKLMESSTALSLPLAPFSIVLPALSLLLVFRSNTGYSRWNEARTLWGGLINNCRNVVRQTNTYFPDDEYHDNLKLRMAAETGTFCKALRNFLRGPADDVQLRTELYELVSARLMSLSQADATMAAANRQMFALNAMSATLRKAQLEPIHSARIDASISTLVDLTGANERIFKSPIPLVYTRLTARFLSLFLLLLPLALWEQLGNTWNHWATIPATALISFFLFAIEEVGIQTEEPFSILPLEAFCNGAIAATNEEMLAAVSSGYFEKPLEGQ